MFFVYKNRKKFIFYKMERITNIKTLIIKYLK